MKLLSGTEPLTSGEYCWDTMSISIISLRISTKS